MIKQLSKKIAGGKHHWNNDDDDQPTSKEEALRAKRELAKAALRERALDLGLEVEHLSLREVEKKRKIDGSVEVGGGLNIRRRSSDACNVYGGIGNVQLLVNLIFILYARWRFKRCSLRSQKSSFYGF